MTRCALRLAPLLCALGACGGRAQELDSEPLACPEPMNERLFASYYPSAYCDWAEQCEPRGFDRNECTARAAYRVLCHEADHCLTESCLDALAYHYDCSLIVACEEAFDMAVNRCEE